MLADLKFVMGAVSRKNLLPGLTHFRIQDGTVRSFNGTLALCAPIGLDFACTPKAEPMYRAIQNCDEPPALVLTPTGNLVIKSGAFRAVVGCITEETPHVTPEGESFDVDGTLLLQALRAVEPYIGDDASRPWTNGVLLDGNSAFATNNIILVEYYVGKPFPQKVNVPELAVREILRIGEPPLTAQLSNNSITFHYESERWIRCQLLDCKWPDLERILSAPATLAPVPDGFFQALRKLKPFTDGIGRVYVDPGQLRTHVDSGEGATHDLPGVLHAGIFNVEMLLSLEEMATAIDFSTYPRPCMFRGAEVDDMYRLRGAIIGLAL